MAEESNSNQSAVESSLDAMAEAISELWGIAEELKQSTPQAVVLYLRFPSKLWPKRIGKFQFCERIKLWIYGGAPIPVSEWNRKESEIYGEIERDYSHLKTGIRIHQEWDQGDPPAWMKNLAQYKVTSETEPQEPETEDLPPPMTEPDDKLGSIRGSSEETLY